MIHNAKLAMASLLDQNPLTKLWRSLDANATLVKEFPKNVKLVEMVMVHVIGSIKDKRTFPVVIFLKSKQMGGLTTHLQLLVGMYAQQIWLLKDFPYNRAFHG